jgi:hypothetical protein
LCLTTGTKQVGKCYTTCTSTSSCAGGGTCLSIQGSACYFCYP